MIKIHFWQEKDKGTIHMKVQGHAGTVSSAYLHLKKRAQRGAVPLYYTVCAGLRYTIS